VSFDQRIECSAYRDPFPIEATEKKTGAIRFAHSGDRKGCDVTLIGLTNLRRIMFNPVQARTLGVSGEEGFEKCRRDSATSSLITQ
jgi:hypothetical protein